MMLTNTAHRELAGTAPPFLRLLRDAFDVRIMELYRYAVEQRASEPPTGVEETVHVHFMEAGLQVTAVYNFAQERFTQLIARDPEEVHIDRPSFTISLFL